MQVRMVQPAVFAAFTLVAVLPFADPAQSFWNARMDVLTPVPAPAVPMRLYEPPARKAILVDADGLAQKTADGIWMTKRDRSVTHVEDRSAGRRNIPVYVHPDETVETEGAGIAERAPVERRIDVTEAPPESDEALAGRVRDAVTADEALFITALNVRVEASGGVVTLAGRVNSGNEKNALIAKASGMPGVVRVEDRLEIAAQA